MMDWEKESKRIPGTASGSEKTAPDRGAVRCFIRDVSLRKPCQLLVASRAGDVPSLAPLLFFTYSGINLAQGLCHIHICHTRCRDFFISCSCRSWTLIELICL